MEMSPEKMKEMLSIVKMCSCEGCSSLPECSSTKCNSTLFCGLGASAKEIEQSGCNCSSCEIAKGMSMEGDYFCQNGPVMD